MKIQILVFVIFLSFLSFPIFGQENSDSLAENGIKYKYAVGLGFGRTTGYGLSFKYTPSKFGIQGTFSPLSDNNDNKISVGLSLFYTLIEDERVSLFLYQGNHYNYSSHQYYNSHKTVTQYFNNGIGFGVELVFYKRFSFNIMTGYAFYENFDHLSLTGEGSIFFRF